MSGHLRKRGSDWELVAFAGRDPLTRRNRYVSRQFSGTKPDAQVALDRLVVEAHDGVHSAVAGTFSELLERWYEIASLDWSPWTVVQQRSVINTYLLRTIGDTPLRKIETADLDRLYAELRRRGKKGQPLAPATVRRIHAVVHSALEQAVKWGWLTRSPASYASPPKNLPAEITPPSPEDLARLLSHVRERDADFHCYLRVAASTGARRSQMCRLRWNDVDCNTATVTFARA